MLYSYGVKLGAKLLARGRVQQSLPFLLRPVNYWRTVEYKLVLDEANFTRSDKVLDIGSPKLLALYLAKWIGAEVFATDIDGYFIGKYSYIRNLEGIPPDRLHVGIEDGRKLSFPDSTFNKLYSISVLEHIPESGDIECAREIGRVLAPGGRCYITVPFYPTSREEFIDAQSFYWAQHSKAAAEKVFYQRRYNEQDLFDRIIKPSGLTLRKLRYVGEHVMAASQRELSDYLPLISGPVQPLVSRLFHTQPVDSWRELKKPLCALIVMEKPQAGLGDRGE